MISTKPLRGDTVIKYGFSPAVRAMLMLQPQSSCPGYCRAGACAQIRSGHSPLGGNNPRVFCCCTSAGQAYLQAKDGVKAAGEFQKILDHNGLNTTSVFSSFGAAGTSPRVRTARRSSERQDGLPGFLRSFGRMLIPMCRCWWRQNRNTRN